MAFKILIFNDQTMEQNVAIDCGHKTMTAILAQLGYLVLEVIACLFLVS